MIMKLMQAAVLVTSRLALGGCPLGGTQTAAPAKKAAGGGLSGAVAAFAARRSDPRQLLQRCRSGRMRARMLQQEMSVVTLQCQNASGGRAYETPISQASSTSTRRDLATNARALQELARSKRFNVDVVVTEFANRTAQKAPVDKEFCSRSLRAFEWALDPKTTSLAQVPPPYDLGPDMNMHPCRRSKDDHGPGTMNMLSLSKRGHGTQETKGGPRGPLFRCPTSDVLGDAPVLVPRAVRPFAVTSRAGAPRRSPAGSPSDRPSPPPATPDAPPAGASTART